MLITSLNSTVASEVHITVSSDNNCDMFIYSTRHKTNVVDLHETGPRDRNMFLWRKNKQHNILWMYHQNPPYMELCILVTYFHAAITFT